MKRAVAVSGLFFGLAAGLVPARAEPVRLDAFFNGTLTGTGSVDNNRDHTHREFTATMKAAWMGPRGRLVEDLVYADGEKKRIVWAFERGADGQFVGHRDDLIGQASVSADGDILHMKYSARTRVPSGSIWNLTFDDHFEQTGPNSVTMQGDITYLFIGVGTTRMVIKRVGR